MFSRALQASYSTNKQQKMCLTRALLLFLSVAPGDLRLWEQAAARVIAEDGATFWTNVVQLASTQHVWPIAVCSGFWNAGIRKSSDGIFGNVRIRQCYDSLRHYFPTSQINHFCSGHTCLNSHPFFTN